MAGLLRRLPALYVVVASKKSAGFRIPRGKCAPVTIPVTTGSQILSLAKFPLMFHALSVSKIRERNIQ